MLALTIFPGRFGVRELDLMLECFLSLVPRSELRRYKLAELEDWRSVNEPKVTISVQQALTEGAWLPYLEPARKRIREGRGFELRLWDGREMDDPHGSFSLSIYGVHRRGQAVSVCAHYLFPVSYDHVRIAEAARWIAAKVTLHSGYGGLEFSHDPRHRGVAFESIFRLARRFWCIDVEDLQATMSADQTGLKTIGWITILGRPMLEEKGAAGLSDAFSRLASAEVARMPDAMVVTLGDAPVAGDINRPESIPEDYFRFAGLTESLLMPAHPSFDGPQFRSDDNTLRWIRRYVVPDGWW